MAKQRYVKPVFWDKKYIRSLGPNGKLLYLYLMTGPLANVAGSYEITVDRMVWDTGLTEIEINAWLEKFEADGKVKFRNDWIAVLNTIEHQQNKVPTIRIGIIELVKCSPDWVKHILSIRYDFLSHLNLNSNLNLNLKKEANGTSAAAANAARQSPGTSQPSVKTDSVDKARQLEPVEQRIWTDGVELLKRSGMDTPSARSLLGRWAKDHGEDVLAEAIAVSQAKNAADPKSFVGGVLRKRKETKSAMRVGAGDYDPEVYSCKACFDTGLRSVPDPDAEFSWMLKEILCEECK